MLYEYELIEYDVWGNKRDGYEVNQAFHTRQYYEIDPDWNNQKLIIKLKEMGLIRKSIRFSSIAIDGDDERITFGYKNKPAFELRKK